MISFENIPQQLLVALIQGILFLIFLAFSQKFIMKPVNAMLEKRKKFMDDEGIHSTSSQKTLVELKEQYRLEIEKIHKNGAGIIFDHKERASEEARKFLDGEKREVDAMIGAKRSELLKAVDSLTREIDDKKAEFVNLITAKLWGSR